MFQVLKLKLATTYEFILEREGKTHKEFVEWFETEIYGDRATFKEGYQEEIIPNVRRD